MPKQEDIKEKENKTEEPALEKKVKAKDKKEKKKTCSVKEYEKIAEEKNELEKEKESLTAKLNGINDKHIRLMAEFENFKKRNAQEKIDLAKTANEKLLLELLPVLDSFEHAYKNISEDDKDNEVFKGLELIHKQVGMFAEKQHLVEIDAVGKPFDPNFHNAISKQDSDEYESDVVVQEYQKGYLYHDKVLRPTMAIISN